MSVITRALPLAALAAVFASGTANAITVDGNLDAEYGVADSSVGYDAAAPLSNFGSPGTTNHAAAYDIYLTSGADFVYGLIRADRASGLPFANLYFNLDPQNGTGTDLGFEITNDRAFVPGRPDLGTGGYSGPLGIDYAFSGDGLSLEFAISNSLFTDAIAGLNDGIGETFATIGGDITLGLSQSFGYSVAGGASYGADRLGRVTLQASAVPEPATWAMMIGGFGLVGGAMRRRAVKVAFA